MTALPLLLIASGVWPHVVGNREAANVISHQLTEQLALSGTFAIRYCVINAFDTAMPAAAAAEVAALEALGVRFINAVKPPLEPAAERGAFGKLGAVLSGRADRLFVGTDCEELLLQSLGMERPAASLVVWAEQAAYLVSRMPGLRFNYAGNPDHKVLAARMELQERLHGASILARLRNNLLCRVARAGHLKSMRRYDQVWNVAANDAADYQQAGVTARYLQNMWPGAVHADWRQVRDEREQLSPLRIVGNVGNIAATGNSFGLITLATEIVPRLVERLGRGNFEVHLFGGGTPHPSVASLLQDPHIRLRGFVDDLDAEIMAAPIFLVANNSRRFKVGHTRFLHAWSLGACVVGFDDSAAAMPEIRDGANALLGDSADAVADRVVQAAQDSALRRRLGQGGVETLASAFAPARVAAEIRQSMLSFLDSSKQGSLD